MSEMTFLHQLRCVQYCVQFLILRTGDDFLQLVGNITKSLCLSFFLSPPFHLHSSHPSPTPIFVSNQIHFQSSLYFILTPSCCQNVLYTATNGQCVCTCVSERLKVCVCYVISPPAALRNNCPECSLCLVMACCYLPPRCAEKKWLSNVMAFLDCSSLIQQQWMDPHLLHLTFKPISIFIKSDFFMAFLLYSKVYSKRDRKWGKAAERAKGSVHADFTRQASPCKYANHRILVFISSAISSLNFLALFVMTFQIWWVG